MAAHASTVPVPAHNRAGLFSPAEYEVLVLVCQGLTPKEISPLRKCSPHTVETHISNLDRKIGEVTERASHTGWNGVKRFIWAIENGYVEAPQRKP